MSRESLRVVIGAVAAALSTMVAVPANGEVWKDTRFVGDHSVLKWVRMDYDPSELVLGTNWRGGYYEGITNYFLDTERESRGPEFLVSVFMDDEAEIGVQLYRTKGFELYGTTDFNGYGDEVVCSGLHEYIKDSGDFKVVLPPDCLAVDGVAPHGVRMSVQWVFFYGGSHGEGSSAWSPARRRFGPTVAVGANVASQ